MTTIAVTGSTGHLGHLVVESLLRRGVPAIDIVALARDLARASDLTGLGVTVRQADYDRPDTLASALAGVDRLLLISGNDLAHRRAQHRTVIDAAKAAGVTRIAYTSVLGVPHTSNPVAPDHVATEDYLAASGVPYVALRNGWYSENYLPTLSTAAATGVVLTSAGDGRVASAARADYAEAAAVALIAEAPEPAYELSGDVAWTQDDLAAAIGEVLGRTITVEQVSPDEHRDRLIAAGVPAGAADFVVGVDAAVATGDLALHPGELGALIGRPTTPLLDTLRAGGSGRA